MRTVERALGIFDCFSQSKPTLSLQEIVARTGLAKSTAFRMVASLVEAGYLMRMENQRYGLSFKFTLLAGLVQSTLSLRDLARPVIVALSQSTGETVTLNGVEGQSRVCLDVVHAPSPLMSVTRSGTRSPLVDGASARVLMSRLEEPLRSRSIAQAARTLGIPRAALAAQLAEVAKRGWSVTHGERVPGLTAVAAPVGDAEGNWPWCVTVAGPTIRLKSRERALVRECCRAAQRISTLMGGRGA
jgi:DNA-binding IclR family transcriptional regulator